VAAGGPGALSAVKSYFKDGFGQPYYLWFFAATLFAGLAAQPFNLYSVFYAKSIGMEMSVYFKCLALTYCFSLVVTYSIGSLADRFHPLRVTIVALAVYAVVMLCGGLLTTNAATFAVALVAHGVASGCLFTASASLAQRLLPRDKFAEIGSAGGIIGSIAGMFFAPILGKFLDYTHHDYRYTFVASAVLTLIALALFIVLHAKFMALGGPKGYAAPK
jgi:MFS family permease